MAAVTPSTSTTLNQALTKKKRNPLPLILLALGVLGAIGFALFGYLESRRTEPVVIFTRDVPYGTQITAEHLGTIEMPLYRPAEVRGITNPNALIGQYAARNLATNDLAQPSMLMPEPPTQPVYPNGEQLQPNMVPLPFATTTIGPITFRDRVNIGFNDPTGDPALCDAAQSAVSGREPTVITPNLSPAQPRPFACRLLSAVRVLYVDEAQGIAYLELSPYQAHTIWALQAANLQLWGERYGVTSDPLDALQRLDAGQVNLDALTAPVPTPQPRNESGIPGGTVIPGTVQP
jgi:hypothetical protein